MKRKLISEHKNNGTDSLVYQVKNNEETQPNKKCKISTEETKILLKNFLSQLLESKNYEFIDKRLNITASRDKRVLTLMELYKGDESKIRSVIQEFNSKILTIDHFYFFKKSLEKGDIEQFCFLTQNTTSEKLYEFILDSENSLLFLIDQIKKLKDGSFDSTECKKGIKVFLSVNNPNFKEYLSNSKITPFCIKEIAHQVTEEIKLETKGSNGDKWRYEVQKDRSECVSTIKSP